jgi:predicted neuraminidase
VELPNGDLLACWYRGSGERTADDVRILGARLRKGAKSWSEPFVLADTPDLPDCNPCLTVGPDRVLRLFYPTILNNQWESALLKSRASSRFQQAAGPPRWDESEVVHLKPGPEFLETVRRDFARAWAPARAAATDEQRTKLDAYLADRTKRAEDKLTVRLGWMPRVRPVWLPGGRMVLPLYSDGFDFSLMAITDDFGKTWRVSAPLVGAGNVQPSIAQRKDGTLVAYFRDNGPPPQRVIASESRDRGETWSFPRDTDVVDTGAGVEAVVLKSGRWLLVNNDLERGRHRLAVHVSEDEGRTWGRTRYVENDAPGDDAGSYSYPSILQARDGVIHLTYSYKPNAERAKVEGRGESIKHVRFSEAWLLDGGGSE